MGEREQNGWRRRLVISCMFATAAVVLSTIVVIVLASLEGAMEQRSSGIDIATDVLGFPLATGWFIVATVFGEWRSIHGGQIALVPVFSIVADAVIIFLAWEFRHRKTSKELKSTGTLRLNG